MTSLYQALKSAARVVRALLSATDASLDSIYRHLQRRGFLMSTPEIFDHDFALSPLVRSQHRGEPGMTCIRELQLLPDRLRAQGVFHSHAGIPQAVRQCKDMRQVV